MNQITDNQSFGQPIPLPLEFKKCGFLLKQEYRTVNTAAYSVTDTLTNDEHGFEVFEIRVQQPKTLPNGVHYPFKEVYPSNEAFGKWAFAPSSVEKAFEYFAKIEIQGLSKTIDFVDPIDVIVKELCEAVF